MSEKRLQQIRESVRGSGFQWELTNLPFTDEEKEVIVEYLAWKLYKLLMDVGIPDGGWKGYDPLMIKDGEAFSYVFDLGEGGRRHAFHDLFHLEQMIIHECMMTIKEHFQSEEDEQS